MLMHVAPHPSQQKQIPANCLKLSRPVLQVCVHMFQSTRLLQHKVLYVPAAAQAVPKELKPGASTSSLAITLAHRHCQHSLRTVSLYIRTLHSQKTSTLTASAT